MCVGVLPVGMSVYRVHGVPRAHKHLKRMLDPLEPELQMVMSYQVGADNPTKVLWNFSQFS